MKLGFIFAGQGSQYVGMGKSLYDHYELAKEVYDGIDLDFDVKALSFEGPEEKLNLTEYTQPCMLAVAISAVKILKAAGITPDMVCGLSLGEYSALACAGVFDEKTAFEVIRYRGQAMADAAKGIECSMVAVLGLDRETLNTCIEEAGQEGYVTISNYNCPGQLVIGGEKAAVAKAAELAKAKGAKRTLPLKTSGPFHTALLKEASLALEKKFKDVIFHDMQVPVVFNTLGREKNADENIPAILTKQVMSSVYFEDCIRYMLSQGVDTIVEIGPGKVLSGFVKKIDRSIRLYQVQDQESVEATISALKEEL